MFISFNHEAHDKAYSNAIRSVYQAMINKLDASKDTALITTPIKGNETGQLD